MKSDRNMKIGLVGAGARESALYKAMKESWRTDQVLMIPGNGGVRPEDRRDVKETDIPGIISLVRAEDLDLLVVGPEVPLAMGLADQCRKHDIRIFGPTAAAARLESDKAFAKDLCTELGIPTAEYRVTRNLEEALLMIHEWGPCVVKANGLAAGKGVVVAKTKEAAIAAVIDCFEHDKFGEAGRTVVIERLLEGDECSIKFVCDGFNAVPLLPARDHKRLLDGDEGPNTGGMGAYAPVPDISSETVLWVRDFIVVPLLRRMRERDTPYQGALYVGLMLTKDGLKVLEFNCRFGDPETQPIFSLLESDPVELFLKATTPMGLFSYQLRWKPGAAVGLTLAAAGYPDNPRKGDEIFFEDLPAGVKFYHAGTAWKDGKLVTNGGRVGTVVARAATHAEARRLVYEGVSKIHFKDMQFRTDIAEGL